MLSCRPNRLNERHATYLMPGEEMNAGGNEEESLKHLRTVALRLPRCPPQHP